MTITPGHTATLTITLNKAGQRLLAKRGTLQAHLTITQNGTILRTRTITFHHRSRKHGKHRRQ